MQGRKGFMEQDRRVDSDQLGRWGTSPNSRAEKRPSQSFATPSLTEISYFDRPPRLVGKYPNPQTLSFEQKGLKYTLGSHQGFQVMDVEKQVLITTDTTEHLNNFQNAILLLNNELLIRFVRKHLKAATIQ